MTLFTALEIYVNPEDLFILIGGPSGEENNFSVTISRGPGYNYKPLFTAREAFKNKEEAICSAEEILHFIIEACKNELQHCDSCVAEVLNPENRTIEEVRALTEENIEKILEDLKNSGKAETFKK